ncbi:MAG: poly(R)-hydroxyalkanoic acid synthase subunit PhaE [Pseudomonadota bacterium]
MSGNDPITQWLEAQKSFIDSIRKVSKANESPDILKGFFDVWQESAGEFLRRTNPPQLSESNGLLDDYVAHISRVLKNLESPFGEEQWSSAIAASQSPPSNLSPWVNTIRSQPTGGEFEGNILAQLHKLFETDKRERLAQDISTFSAANKRYQQAMGNIALCAVEEFSRAYRDINPNSNEQTQSMSLRSVIELWCETYDRHHIQFVSGSEYPQLFGDLLNAQMRLNLTLFKIHDSGDGEIDKLQALVQGLTAENAKLKGEISALKKAKSRAAKSKPSNG